MNTTAGTTESGGKKKLMGEDLKFERIDAIHLRDVAEQEGITCNEASAKALAVAVQAYFRDKYGKVTSGGDELLECSTCKGYSPERLKECAFCGEGDDGAPPADKPPPSPKSEAKVEAKAEPKAADAKGDKKGKKDKAPKAEDAPSTALAKPAPTAIVNDAVVSSELLTEATLDEQIKKVRATINDHLGSRYDVGVALLVIHKQDLWKLRTENGKQRWKTFDAFCIDELGFSSQWAYMIMNLAEEYSREQYIAIGPKKLLIASQASTKEMKEKLLKSAESGASRRELEAEVRAANAKIDKSKPKADRDGVVRAKKDGTRGGREKKPEPRITVASIVGTQTYKAYKKPARTRGVEIDEKNLARAKKVGDVPWTRFPLGNGVYMDLTLKATATGELVFHVETRRDGE